MKAARSGAEMFPRLDIGIVESKWTNCRIIGIGEADARSLKSEVLNDFRDVAGGS